MSDKDFKKPTTISNVMPSVLSSLGVKRSCDGWMAVEKWPEIVGPDIASESKAVRFQDGVLYVEVARDVWRQEIHMQLGLILEKIRKLPYGGAVKEIRLLGRQRGH